MAQPFGFMRGRGATVLNTFNKQHLKKPWKQTTNILHIEEGIAIILDDIFVLIISRHMFNYLDMKIKEIPLLQVILVVKWFHPIYIIYLTN